MVLRLQAGDWKVMGWSPGTSMETFDPRLPDQQENSPPTVWVLKKNAARHFKNGKY